MDNRYDEYTSQLRKALPIGQSFDVKERKLSVGGRKASLFYVEGLVDGQKMQLVLSFLLDLKRREVAHAKTSKDFVEFNVPFLSCNAETKVETVIKMMLSGLVALAIDGYDEILLLDVRTYPTRSVAEPEKEKTLRGAKDGFTEAFMMNIALIRRRLRDPDLIFEIHTVGKMTKTDVSVVYLRGYAKEEQVRALGKKIDEIKVNTITVGEQTLIEMIGGIEGKKKKKPSNWFNPFPKVRYTQRPDVVAAHVAEGKIAIVVDNSPTVILLPSGIFDFMQDVDDYYFPAITGNYFRFLRIGNFLMILFLTPIYLLMVDGYIPAYLIGFFVPEKTFAIPIFWQFIILELAIDALKLASLNTPNSLGMSLSVIGALILGDFSVQSGWFIPQTILCMAVVALASFTQPSMELQYGIKFMRILVLVGVAVAGILGGCIGLAIGLIVMGTTKTLVGTSYLYPLIPFDRKALTRLIFRTKKGKER